MNHISRNQPGEIQKGGNMNNTFLIEILGGNPDELDKLEKMLDQPSYKIEKVELSEDKRIANTYKKADLHIVCLSPDVEYQMALASQFTEFTSDKILYIAYSVDNSIRKWAFEHGASSYMLEPVNPHELCMVVDQLLFAGSLKEQENTSETILSFLKAMVSENKKSIQPVSDPNKNLGHFYPDLSRHIENIGNGVEFLQHLVERNLLQSSVANRIRICPACSAHQLNYREVCPRCQSVDIHSKETIHHFSCGHVNVIEHYRRGAELVCPKYDKQLRHIGMDYERPTDYSQCNACNYIAPEPDVQVQCLQCGSTYKTDDTLERIICSYNLTEEAIQAVSSGQLEGLNLDTLLHDRVTGLYSRQYFEHQTEKEFARATRYKQEFSIFMIKINDLEHVRDHHADYLDDYVKSILGAITDHLRLLDTTCIWDPETVAILLPETGLNGGEIVASRMKQQVAALEYLYHIHKPEITLAFSPFNSSYSTHSDMISTTYKQLNQG